MRFDKHGRITLKIATGKKKKKKKKKNEKKINIQLTKMTCKGFDLKKLSWIECEIQEAKSRFPIVITVFLLSDLIRSAYVYGIHQSFKTVDLCLELKQARAIYIYIYMCVCVCVCVCVCYAKVLQKAMNLTQKEDP